MNLQPTVLIVDDEKHTRDGLRSLLENDYDVYVAPDILGAMNVLEREQIDVLLTDLRLGSEDGMTLIDRALKMPRPPACIMMTAYGSVDVAVEAMKRGAYDFVTKPLNLDKVELLIASAVQGRRLEQENRASGSKWMNVTASKTFGATRPRCMKCSIRFGRLRPRQPMCSLKAKAGQVKN